MSKHHAEELKALEEKLNAQHAAELKTRIDAAVDAANKTRPASAPAVNTADQQATIDAAIAEFKKDLETRHAEEIASAVDRGRMEQVAKGKLKDSQLVKAQKRVKDLEAQIHEWQGAGLIPTATPATGAPAGAAVSAAVNAPASAPATAAIPAAITQAPAAKPAAPSATAGAAAGPSQTRPNPAAAATAAAANATHLPRKPLVGGATTSGGVGLGRGGAMAGRGRGGPGLGRGNAPLRTAPVRTSPATNAAPSPTTGVSIMGAAAKRPHSEDGSVASDGSLAKRLKPTQPS